MMYNGPLAHAEYIRMKAEIESLRKVRVFILCKTGGGVERSMQQVAMGKKTITKQSKVRNVPLPRHFMLRCYVPGDR